MASMNSNEPNAGPGRTGAVLLCAILCAAGCHSSGYKKGDVAARSLHTAAVEVRAESRAIDTTMELLNDLVNRPAADLKPQFKRFSRALDHLEQTAARTERRREDMEAKNEQYFEVWDRQATNIQFGIVREQSESRRAAVTNEFHAINTRYLEAQDVVRPLISYFNDIRRALSVDLTPRGLESVRAIVENADRNARTVQLALGRLTQELTSSGEELSSVRVRHAVAPEQTAPPASSP